MQIIIDIRRGSRGWIRGTDPLSKTEHLKFWWQPSFYYYFIFVIIIIFFFFFCFFLFSLKNGHFYLVFNPSGLCFVSLFAWCISLFHWVYFVSSVDRYIEQNICFYSFRGRQWETYKIAVINSSAKRITISL